MFPAFHRRAAPARHAAITANVDRPRGPTVVRAQRLALTVLLVVALAGAAWVASGLWVGLVLGGAMGFTCQRLHGRLAARLAGRSRLAAGLITLGTGLSLALLMSFVAYLLTEELVALVSGAAPYLARNTLLDFLGDSGLGLVDRLHIDRAALDGRMRAELAKVAAYSAGAAQMIVGAASHALVGLLVALWTMYYVLVDWPRIARRLERLLPLDPTHTRTLVCAFRDVTRTALIGTGATALTQGALASIGFAIAGVPQPVLWGVVTTLTSLIPVFGTALTWGPLAAYLLLQGHPVQAAFLAGWGLFVVMALTDYVIRPRFIRSREQANPLLAFVSIVGGVELFGLPGLLVGPIVMTLFVSVLRLYERAPRDGDEAPSEAVAAKPS